MCDAFEQQVADGVAQAVIDVLEAIQIEEQDCAEAAGLFAVQQGGLKPALEQYSVGQAGERVMMGLIVEARLGVFEAGNVGEDGDEVGQEVVFVAHGTDGQPARVKLAVLAAVADFALPVALGCQLVPHRGIERAVMLAGGKQARGLPDGFTFAVASDFRERAVDGADALVGIGDEHTLGSALENSRREMQFLLHLPAFGDIPCNRQQTVFTCNDEGLRGQFAQSNIAIVVTNPDPQIPDETMLFHLLDEY